MRLVADECVARHVVERLRANGHEVTYVLEDAPGISDETVLARAVELQLPLLTEDRDFGELVFQHGRGATGVILLRLRGSSPGAKATMVADVIRDYRNVIPTSFLVVSPGRIRVRRFEP